MDAVVSVSISSPLLLEFFQLWQQLRSDGCALQAFHDVGLHGDGVVAVLPPHHAWLPAELRLGHLQQWHRFARGCGHISVAKVSDGLSLCLRLAQHDVDQLIALTELAHGGATEQHTRSLRNRLAGHAQCTGLFLIHGQANDLDGLVPVVVHASGVGVGSHHRLDLIRPQTQGMRVRPSHAKLHRERHGWTIGQQLHTGPYLGKFFGHDGWQCHPQAFTNLEVFGKNDELRNIALRKDLVQGQVKTRHARTYPQAN